MPAGAIHVTVGKLPGRIRQVALEVDHPTVGTVLETANLDPEGYEVRYNGQPTELNVPVEDGSYVHLIRRIRGNGGG